MTGLEPSRLAPPLAPVALGPRGALLPEQLLSGKAGLAACNSSM